MNFSPISLFPSLKLKRYTIVLKEKKGKREWRKRRKKMYKELWMNKYGQGLQGRNMEIKAKQKYRIPDRPVTL